MTTTANSTNPMQDLRLLVHAYLDGELDTANALAIKQQIEANPTLATRLKNYTALQNVLRTRFPGEQISPLLRTRINAAIGIRRRWARPTWGALAASILLAVALSSSSTWLVLRSYQSGLVSTRAVDDQVAFPRELGVLYATLERVEDGPGGRFRELYADQAALDAVRAGKPLPYGTVLVRAIYDVLRDPKGAPVKDANGRLTKTKLLSVNVMEKRAGWGGKHPAGEWDYQSFAPDGTRLAEPAASACFECHHQVQAQDFVFRLDLMKAAKRQGASLWR